MEFVVITDIPMSNGPVVVQFMSFVTQIIIIVIIIIMPSTACSPADGTHLD
jgi:hypothetical protein